MSFYLTSKQIEIGISLKSYEYIAGYHLRVSLQNGPHLISQSQSFDQLSPGLTA